MDDVRESASMQGGRYPGLAHGDRETQYRVNRPWGSFESLRCGERFQVKHITVRPGGRLSLQKHYHRAEHWVVVKGTALATCGETVRLLSENDALFIPVGAIHRLENPGKLPLELIEVQTGPYLGEDDIVRIEDDHGRVSATADVAPEPDTTRSG